MNVIRLSVVVVSGLALVMSAPAQEKTNNKDKIIGTWEVTKSESEIPAGTTMEFAKDGTFVIKSKMDDKAVTISGTYALEGDKMKVVYKINDKEMKETLTIKTLTDKKFVTVDERGKTDEFKKK